MTRRIVFSFPQLTSFDHDKERKMRSLSNLGETETETESEKETNHRPRGYSVTIAHQKFCITFRHAVDEKGCL